MAEDLAVQMHRVDERQRYILSAPDVAQRWSVRQWASKPRASRGEFAPWWYEEGKTWHVYAGEEPGEGPPLVSCATVAEVKAYVESLVAGVRAAG